jgi:peptidoglycan/LPS O-acetylase OafA/YrhL
LARANSIPEQIARLFGRVTTSGRQIREVDGLRFIAIAFVFLQHTQQMVVRDVVGAGANMDVIALCLDLARFGVEVFFAISGFILGLPFAESALIGGPRVRLGSYFLRRLTRLEPPYLLALGGSFAIGVWCLGQPAREMAPHLAASAAYVHNITYGPKHNPFNPVTWSLEVEVQFYCLVPLITLFYRISLAVASSRLVRGDLPCRPADDQVDVLAWLAPARIGSGVPTLFYHRSRHRGPLHNRLAPEP